MSEWVDISMLCQNCGKNLLARFDHETAARRGYIQGCKPVKLKHTDGTPECVKRWPEPRAFDAWAVNRELEKAKP